MNHTTTYDYIIAGAGCAGLSLAVHLIHSGRFGNKKILLVDKEVKDKNDRTWCFWEREEGLFQSIVYKQWEQLYFHSATFSKALELQPYQYKLIRGIDFYRHCLQLVQQQPNFTIVQAPVEHLFSSTAEGTGLVAGGIRYTCQYLFNSILFGKPALKKHHIWLLQHFKGWVVETAAPQFNEKVGTMMDFRTDQSEGATFFYVMPFSPTKALVEYTLFSKAVLPEAAYTAALKDYVERRLGIDEYKVAEEEFGIIPMSNYSFAPVQHHIIHMGTAGGQTKGSSGYTFKAIQKHAAALVGSLVKVGNPFTVDRTSRRFHFYDSVLLHILQHNTLPGDLIFTELFKKNKPAQVLKFLDNETSLAEDIGLIHTLPTLPFLKAAIKQVGAAV